MGPGAIGNATWTGVALAFVLRAYKADLHPGRHVAFACADMCELEGKHFNYSVSIPIGKVARRVTPYFDVTMPSTTVRSNSN